MSTILDAELIKFKKLGNEYHIKLMQTLEMNYNILRRIITLKKLNPDDIPLK